MPIHTELAAGTIVGEDFRVLELLGAGGMGAVYAAEQLSTGRRRALKVLHELTLDDSKQRDRFVREAKVGAVIDSAHVVEVISAGIGQDGQAWIAMELLDGEDLNQLLARKGPLTPTELGELLEQLCHALGAAHRARIVHRDIKPENIYVTKPREARGRPLVKVLDFGIAKLASQVRTGHTTQVGSPAWMAPEQASLEVPVSPGTDVWAIGLLAFWLLTGRSYWKSWQEGDVSIHALMKEVLFDPLPLASKRSAELGVADRLPAGFDDWFERCVHREPQARFRDADELLAACKPWVAEEGDDTAAGRADAAELPEAGVSTEPMSTRAFLSNSQIGADELSISEPPPPAAEEPAPERADQASAARPDESTETGADDSAEPAAGAAAPSEEPASAAVVESSDDGQPPAAPLPASETSEPSVLEPTAAKPGRSRRGWALAAIGVAAVALLGGWLLLRSGHEGTADLAVGMADGTPAGGADQPHALDSSGASAGGAAPEGAAGARAAAGGAAADEPAADPTPTPSSRQATSAPPGPASTASPESPGSASAEPALPPFDRRQAERTIAMRVRSIRMQCAHREGPRTITGTVVFEPSGRVKQVSNNNMRERATLSVLCVLQMMRITKVPAYDGGDEPMPFTVNLD